jgi:hypothetical protein
VTGEEEGSARRAALGGDQADEGGRRAFDPRDSPAHRPDRNTVRRALRREGPPRYERPPRPSKLDRFKDEIHRLLQDDARIPGTRVRELIEALGYDGGKTILDDYLREVRPLYERRRTYQRTSYRPGECCSSTCSSRGSRSRSATARHGAATS